jgi:hypothetical protein
VGVTGVRRERHGEKNGSGAAPSAKFRGTEPTRIQREYSRGSRSAPAAPDPNARGSGSAPLRSHGSPTKHTGRVSKSKSRIARLTLCWRKASDPNDPSTYALNENTMN